MEKHRLIILLTSLLLAACAPQTATQPTASPNRQQSIPADAVKILPEDDPFPPVAAEGWSQPQPLPAPINTAGAEDSPFLAPDDETFFFFFTPDLNIPAEKQLLDGVTGIWVTSRTAQGWQEPRRVLLAAPGELALDGCPFATQDSLYFCSIRAGNQRELDLYLARWQDGAAQDWQKWGEPFNTAYQVGEFHITADGQWLYFASQRSGGYGGYDLWVSDWDGNQWGEPRNLGSAINTPNDENRPAVTADGSELWFDAPSQKGLPGPAIYRSVRQPDGSWSAPQEMISSFAGEPALSCDGNTLYFVHHYLTADMSRILEADIYVSQRQP